MGGLKINISKNFKNLGAGLDSKSKTEVDVENRIKPTRRFYGLPKKDLWDGIDTNSMEVNLELNLKQQR